MEAPNPKYLYENKDFFILIGLSIRRERNVSITANQKEADKL
jgi:hypothetical protein